jgi:hypothetical protein
MGNVFDNYKVYFPFGNGADSDGAPSWISYGLAQALSRPKRGNELQKGENSEGEIILDSINSGLDTWRRGYHLFAGSMNSENSGVLKRCYNAT